MDNFQEQKQKQLAKSDKSNIGEWDEKISSLCDKINKSKNYYTTSSCSGRVVLLKASDKKMKDAFLFRTHNKITFKELKKSLEEIKKTYKEMVEFQQTCCILHVACKNINDAFDIVKKAKLCGWKRSGVMTNGKRCIVELHSTESISFPIMNNGDILVDDNFLKLIVELANNKLERVWVKIERLKNLL
jgi:tRNA wybutosine-synthesizing protein 3